MTWRVVLERDDETGDWAAWVPELPGCVSAGDTQDEALENIREAIALYLQPDPISVSPDAIITEIAAVMSERIRRMTSREVEAVLARYGFELVSQHGSHRKWRHQEQRLQVI